MASLHDVVLCEFKCKEWRPSVVASFYVVYAFHKLTGRGGASKCCLVSFTALVYLFEGLYFCGGLRAYELLHELARPLCDGVQFKAVVLCAVLL